MNRELFLEKIQITNFLSLRDVELPLKPLTILVGPNASGKSNVLNALELLKNMLNKENPPSMKFLQDKIWAGGANTIGFKLFANVDNKSVNYHLELQSEVENRIAIEELLIGNVKVISVEKGQGEVRDEDNENSIAYRSTKLALKSAGDYGNKPMTNVLTEFIQGWEFYNFKPDTMRIFMTREHPLVLLISQTTKNKGAPYQLDDDGSILKNLLSDWHKNHPKGFEDVNSALRRCSRLGIEYRGDNGEGELYLQESQSYKNPIPLERASDGTLRLIAYHILLNQAEHPSLIAIEEPERNLHPGALKEIGSILDQLAEQTPVIITTHSSQLLDTFNPDDLSDKLGVLLLQNKPGIGTEVMNLEEVSQDRKALKGWIEDFGIGSAIFHSELLQDVMEQ
jgi:predicted ATPase